MSASANGLALHPQTPPSPEVVSSEVTPYPDRAQSRSRPTLKKPTHLSWQQILDATELCLAAEGYDGTTIRRIARQLGCAVGSIYRYFKDKRELLTAVTHRRFEPVETACEAGMAMDQVQRMYARIANEQPEQYRLMFWLASVGQSQAGRHLPAVIERLIERWADRVGDSRQAELQWAQLHGDLMLGRFFPPASEVNPTPASIPENIPDPATFPITSTEDLTLL